MIAARRARAWSVPTDPGHRRIARAVGASILAVLTGALVAVIAAGGAWYLALVAALALPAFVAVQRAPLVTYAVWAVVLSSVFQLEGPTKYLMWLAHRAIPLAALALVVLAGIVGLRSEPLPRLGGAEAMMAGYLVVTFVSVAYSDYSAQTFIDLFDRLVAPMLLYLGLRLFRCDRGSLQRFVPVLAFVIVSQTVVGALSWFAPGTLPGEWLNRAGTRTTGTLGSPSTYGVTMGLCGLLLLHASHWAPGRLRRAGMQALFVLSVLMMVFTLSRGVWLAAALVCVAAVVIHGRQLLRLVPVLIVVVAVVGFSGAAIGTLDRIENRLESDQTALARLPLAYASLAMFEQRPLTGWGYGNFDRYDREFQRPVDGFVPEKDHTSHNLYLRILAEQGAVGAFLYLGPAVYWLVRARRVFPFLSRSDPLGSGLLVVLVTGLATHVVVNNFSDMTNSFGLGQWWMMLAGIALVVDRVERSFVEVRT